MILILCMLFSCVRDSVNETNASRYFINLNQNMENVSVCLTQFWELCEPLSSNLPDLYPSVKDRKRPHLRSHSPVVPKMQTINIPGTLHIPIIFSSFFQSWFCIALTNNMVCSWTCWKLTCAMSHAVTWSFRATKSKEWTLCGTFLAIFASPHPKSATTLLPGLKSKMIHSHDPHLSVPKI